MPDHHELQLPSSGEQGDFAQGSIFFVGTATYLSHGGTYNFEVSRFHAATR